MCKDEAKRLWKTFGKYHYLSETLHPASESYAAFWGDNPIAFCAITHFPHPTNKRIKKVHRLVTLPDYQGIGVGVSFLNEIGKIYFENGYDFRLVTSAQNLAHALKKNEYWKLVRYGRLKRDKKSKLAKMMKSWNRNTYSFVYDSNSKANTEGLSG